MATAIEYALMAGASYISTRAEVNRFPVPPDWVERTDERRALPSGFEASYFTKGTEIVISFAGTGPFGNGDWINANIPLATGSLSDQLRQAADYYLQVKASAPVRAIISFTGHSLGGGLASLLGVFFGESAFTFDQAPFRNSALTVTTTDSNTGIVTARSVAQDLRTYLASRFPGIMLAPLDAYIIAADPFNSSPNVPDTLAAREARVADINVQGEAVSLLPFSRIGSQADIPQQNNMSIPVIAQINLHSHALLTAFLQSNQTAKPFRKLSDVTFKLTDLLGMIFDKKLYSFDTDKVDENFLERLIKHEAGKGTALPSDAMVTRFTSDMWKLAQDGGLTLHDGNTDSPDLNEISKTLMAFAMQKYYGETNASPGYNKELFTKIAGGVRFNRNDVADTLANAKGFDQYFKNYLSQAHNGLTDSDRSLIQSRLPDLLDWFIQAGTQGMVAMAGTRSAFMLSGDGNDVLIDGTGNDLLIGGKGRDVYVFKSGDGQDQVIDSDGKGVLIRADQGLVLGVKQDDTHWSLGSTTYTKTDDTTLDVAFTSGGDKITIKDFDFAAAKQSGYLGIRLIDAPTLAQKPQTSRDITGDLEFRRDTAVVPVVDFQPVVTDSTWRNVQVVQFIGSPVTSAKVVYNTIDDLGNLVRSGTAQDDVADNFNDSTGNDHIVTGGGRDIINALRGGADVIEAGTGADIVHAGAGADWIDGGGGDDGINGEADDDFATGGAGRDLVDGGEGNDWLEGGTGGDIVLGGAGGDAIYADTGRDGSGQALSIEALLAAGETGDQATGPADLLSGGDGDDFLFGAATADLLLGGAGADVLVGGAGDDTIYGDAALGFFSLDWSIERQVTDAAQYVTLTTNTEVFDDAAIGAADAIYGGAGDDWIFAGAGDDYVEGGSGKDALFGDAGSDVLIGGADDDVLVGDSPDVDAAGLSGDDYLDGGAGADRLFGGMGADILVGGEGDDTLNGGEGDDILYGGPGQDILSGGAGKDTYVFNRGDGIEVVQDLPAGAGNPEASVLVLGEGITREDVKFGVGSLLIDLGHGDAIHFNGFSPGDPNSTPVLDSIQFADGTSMSYQDVLDQGFDLDGTEGDDFISGTAVTDRIDGKGGNDVLTGGEGNDVLTGGTGADQLFGQSGKDTYLFNRGDGADVVEDAPQKADFSDASVLRLGEGIAREEVTFRLDDARNLVVDVGQGDKVAFAGFNADDPVSMPVLDSIEFAGGSSMSYADILAQGFDFEGTAGNDALIGTAVTDRFELEGGADYARGGEGDDVLHGGAGDDVLDGGAGNDLLDGGDGNDILYGGEGNDVLIGGAGSNSLQGGAGDDAIFAGNGDTVIDTEGDNHLDLTAYAALTTSNAEITQFQADGGDIYLNIHVRDSAHPGATPDAGGVSLQGGLASFGTLTLNDGQGGTTTLTSGELARYVAGGLIINGTAGADRIFGTDADDTIRGLAGADTIDAGAGNDRIDGGSGNDTLIGGAGNDTYLLAYNGGRDTLIEDGNAEPGSKNTIQLDGGIAFSMLQSSRIGNDLRIDIKGTGDGVLIKDFYVQPQTWQEGWSLLDGDGNTLGVAEVAPAAIPSAAQWLGTLEDDFKARREQVFAAGLAADGFVPSGAHGGKRVDRGFSFEAGQTTSTTNITSLQTSISRSGADPILAVAKVDQRALVTSAIQRVGRSVRQSTGEGRSAPQSNFPLAANSGRPNPYFVPAVGGIDVPQGATLTPAFSPNGVDLIGWWVHTGPAPTQSSPAQTQRLFGDAVETIAIDTSVSRTIAVPDVDTSSSDAPREIVAQSGLVHAGGGDDNITLDLSESLSQFSNVAEDYFRLRDWRSDISLQSAPDLRSPWHAVSRYVLAHTPSDQLTPGFFNNWPVADQQNYLGGFIDAGGGDDFLTGSSGQDTIAGGDGNDDIDGLGGSDAYLYAADETGVDVLSDDGSGLLAYLDWFYWNRGIANWDERMVYGGLYRSDLDFRQALEGPEYFATKQEASPTQDRIATFVPALSVGAPILRRTDTAALESLMEAGVLPRDVVKFGPGLDLADLELTMRSFTPWDDVNHPQTPLYNGGMLSVRWGNAGVDLVVPDVNFGFEFADGQTTLPTTALKIDFVDGFPVIGAALDFRSLGDYRLGAGVDDFQFADGTMYSLEQILHLAKLSIVGTPGDDFLFGGSQDELIDGLAGDDYIDGFSGNDTLRGGSGSDTYFFARGYGRDTVLDQDGALAGLDAVSFDADIAPADIDLSRHGGNYTLTIHGTADSLTLQGQFNDENLIEEVAFDDGTIWDADYLHDQFAAQNQAPILSRSMDGQSVVAGGNFGFAVPAGTFFDADNDALSYSATLADGSPLPQWLSLDAQSGTFSGRVPQSGQGMFGVTVTATDPFGASAQNTFSVDVLADRPPVLAHPLTDRRAADGLQFSFAIPADTFSDPDAGDSLAYEAALADGSALPAWLRFDPSTVTFSGTPGDSDVGDLFAVRVTATDGGDLSAFTDFNITVTPPGQTLIGTPSDDFLEGGAGDDLIEGLGGFDSLFGHDGNDTLMGGPDDDYMEGGPGDDTYSYNAGDGFDDILDEGGFDTLKFGAGILPSDLLVQESPFGLVVGVGGGRNVVFIESWFNADNRIEQLAFADGTVWNAAQIESHVSIAPGTPLDDLILGDANDNVLDGLAGDDDVEGGGGNDIVSGGDGDDGVSGDAGSNLLLGGAGDDSLFADDASGRNLFIGGAGSDGIQTDAGGSVVAFNAGDGEDGLYDHLFDGSAGAPLVLSLGGMSASDIVLSTDGSTVRIGLSDADGVSSHGYAGDPARWPSGTLQIIGADIRTYDLNAVVRAFFDARAQHPSITQWSAAQALNANLLSVSTTDAYGGAIAYQYATAGNVDGLSTAQKQSILHDADFVLAPQTISAPNQAPMIANALADQTTNEDSTFSFTVPVDTFVDPDAGDTLAYSAMLADGDPLPGWLSFDPATRTFSGTPPNGVGPVSLKVTATDGGGLSVSDSFDVAVANTNHAPTDLALSANAVTENAPNATVGTLSTNDPDAGDTFTYSLQAGGDAAQFALSGNVLKVGATGLDHEAGATRSVTVRTTDAGGAFFDRSFTLNVTNVNEAPMVASAIADQTTTEYLPFSLNAAGTFSDPGAGDTLAYSAMLANGNPLPAWLTFDPATQTFSGAPVAADLGTINVTVTATDSGALSALDSFSVTVAPTPDRILIGTDGDDVLVGRSGNDRLEGGLGADTMSGARGNDTYVVDNAGDQAIENPGEGSDTVESSISFTLPANVEKLTLTGTADINGTGNTTANTITGNSGANVLDGATGADTMMGGAGDDTYRVERAGDIVIENPDEGLDTVLASATYTLSANVENLVLTGTSGLRGTGNALANVITGNSGGNVLDGAAGADTLVGGLGNDTYVVDDVNDVPVENPGEGTDTVKASVSWTLGGDFENLTLTGTAAITGSGNAQNNVLTGNAAASTLIGGLGNDTYVVSDAGTAIAENAGEGTDVVKASVTYALADNLENLTLTGTAAIDGTGNAQNNALTGNAAANMLSGGDGNDTLNGGGGGDTLIGGTGNDVYVVDNVDDLVVENLNEGTDLVKTSVSYYLTDNVENLTLTGTQAIDGWGSALNNVLTGNAAANMLCGAEGNDALNGNGGADTLIGGAGNDTYTVNETGVTVIENVGEGIDLVKSALDYTLGDNFENLTLTGTANLNGFGNALDNTIVGNSGANLLEGFAGNDTLSGNLANDVLQGGAGSDTLRDSGGNNLLDGGSGNDSLAGNAGNEMFVGGTGNDTVNTGTGGDIIAFNRGDGQDTVAASQGADNTLSLGGGIRYQDLAFRKSGTNLIVQLGVNSQTGVAEQVSFSGWYSTTANNKSLATLQINAEAMAGFDLNSSDPLLNRKIQSFDFQGLATAFDAARAANPKLTSWGLSNALSQNSLGGSDTEAIGGDLACAYGRNGTLAGVGLDVAQGVIGASGFGIQAQALTHVYEGGAGNDRLYASPANSLLSGGSGDDNLTGGEGNDFLAGDTGNDTIDTGGGANVIAFNAGGGTDIVQSASGATNTLSMGNGIGYDDLSLSKNGNDLIVNTGENDHLVFKDWYGGKDNVVNLQVILDATAAFDAGSSDPLYNKKVQSFDFRGLVNAFDEARAQTPGLSSWAVTNGLLQFHLSGADDAALGGDLAYWYGKNGSLGGIGLQAAQQVIGAPGFGSEAQSLHSFDGLREGMVKLT